MKRIIGFLCGILLSMNLFAQSVSPEVVGTAGSVFINTNGSISFTVGEAIVETVTDGNYTLTQGFQQANYYLTTIEEKAGANLNIQLFPNPLVKGFNVIHNGEKLLLNIYHINGQLLISNTLSTSSTFIDMSAYAAGTYVVQLYNKKQEIVGIYKIQKLISQ